MSTEIVTATSELDSEWRYAQALVAQPERGAQSLLPQAYRGNPANVLIAMGLGKAIGITPAQALYEVYVVNGRPSPSANLMAALVRRAGHKLRIKGDAQECTATLIRSDDPDEPFEATWTFAQARAAGLTNKDTWKSYPAAMLRARAIAEVVRMGASEAVLGMEYAKEEMQDVEPEVRREVKPTGSAALRAAVATEPEPEPAPDTIDAEVVEAVEEERADAQPITDKTRRKMFALFNAKGIGEDQQLSGINHITGKGYESRGDLTEADALAVIDVLNQRPDAAAEQGDLLGGSA